MHENQYEKSILEEKIKKLQEEIDFKDKLLKNNSLLNTIYNTGDLVLFSLDLNYCYLSFNNNHFQTIKKIWNKEIEVGMNMLEIITLNEDKVKAKSNFDRALAGECFTCVEEYGDQNFTRTFYEDSYSSLKDENGRIYGVTVYVKDITNIKLNELKLIMQNDLLKQITWQQSHEVRRPLSNILGLINLMEMEMEWSANQLHLESLKIATEELDKIIHVIVQKSNTD